MCLPTNFWSSYLTPHASKTTPHVITPFRAATLTINSAVQIYVPCAESVGRLCFTVCLALLNRIAIRRGYAIPNFCVVRLRSRCRKLLVQMLSPLKSIDR